MELIVALHNFANAPKSVTTIMTTYPLKTGNAATSRKSHCTIPHTMENISTVRRNNHLQKQQS